MATVQDIAAAVADELQLSSAELLSVTQVTVSITYKVDRESHPDDWMDEWYEEYCKREVVPF